MEIQTEHLLASRNILIRVASGTLHGLDRAGCGEALGIQSFVTENGAWVVEEGEGEGRVVLEEPAELWLPNKVGAELKGVPAAVNGQVVPELPLPLERLLRHIPVGSEVLAAGERKVWDLGG